MKEYYTAKGIIQNYQIVHEFLPDSAKGSGGGGGLGIPRPNPSSLQSNPKEPGIYNRAHKITSCYHQNTFIFNYFKHHL